MEKTLLPVIIALVGGSGHFLGPVVGGMVVQGIDLGLRYGALPVPALAIFGLLLMVIGLFLPGGLLSVLPPEKTSWQRVTPYSTTATAATG